LSETILHNAVARLP